MDDNIQNIENDHQNNQEPNEIAVETRKPTVAQVSLIFSVALIGFMLLSRFIGMIPIGDYYLKALSSEIFLVAVPPLLFLIAFKFNLKKVLRLNKVSLLNLLIIFGIMCMAIPVVAFLNLINLFLIKLMFGKIMVDTIPQIKTFTELLFGVIVIGISAGVCEEILFRGVIQRGYEKLGIVKAIIITAFLFGLMHHDFQKLLGTFLLGALIGLIVYRTNSLLGGMFAHFTNNSVIVLITFGAGKLTDMMKEKGLDKAVGGEYDADKYFSTLLNGPKSQLIAVILVYGIAFLLFATAFGALIYAFIKNTSKTVVKPIVDRKSLNLKGLLWLAPGILFIGFLYFAEGLHLRGIKMEMVESILKFMGLA